MDNEELRVIDSKINNLNELRIFDEVLNKIKSSGSNLNQNLNEKTFIQEVDERLKKLEIMKDMLKGDASYLESNKKLMKRTEKERQKSKRVRKKLFEQSKSKSRINFHFFS